MINKPLKCNGCTACCKGDAIRRLKNDDRALKWVKHPYMTGEFMLDHKPNGDCIYLINNGCGLHGTDSKPQQCKGMDCRRVYSTIKNKSKALSMGVGLDTWKRGRELTKRDHYLIRD